MSANGSWWTRRIGASLVAALLLAGGAVPAKAGGEEELRTLVLDLAQSRAERPTTIPGLLWWMAEDESFSEEVLTRADARHRALTDSLLSFVALKEPAARAQLPDLYRIVDGGPAPPERPTSWPDLQWEGVQLLSRIAPDPEVGRDIRLRRDLAEAMERVRFPQPAAVAGAVLVLERWWAERGEDPGLTHDPSRIPDLDPWLRRLDLPFSDEEAWTAPHMVADLDADPVLRERILARLEPARHAHLAAELAAVLEMLPETLREEGIEPRRWDPDTQTTVGHATLDLWRLSIRMLEVVTGEPISGADDRIRRYAALAWWDRHRHEGRYWRDPRDAPSLAPYLEGLDRPEAEGGQNAGAWARSLYLEPSVADVVLERLGAPHRGLVAELVALLPMDRESAHRAGFAQAMLRRSPDSPPGSRGQTVGIDWDDARRFVRRVLEVLTGLSPPPGVTGQDADAFWERWWNEHRDEAVWSRARAGGGESG